MATGTSYETNFCSKLYTMLLELAYKSEYVTVENLRPCGEMIVKTLKLLSGMNNE